MQWLRNLNGPFPGRRWALAALAAGIAASTMLVHGQGSCGSQANPIVCENALTGNPPSDWDLSPSPMSPPFGGNSGDTTIQGFATDISVNKGDTVHFKVNTKAPAFKVDIYRMGYYGGNGARKIATIASVAGQAQPNCLTNSATGLIDCGNWSESTTWAVPSTTVSGIYFAKLTRLDTGGASHIFFVVRDDFGAADVLFQTSDTTWQAYNDYGGNSLYVGGPGTNPGRAYKVSYNRPFNTRGDSGQDWVFNAEYPMVRWLESNGYNVSYFTGVDTDRFGATKLAGHRVFMSVGHDEYWSGPQRANVEAARAAGVNLAFLSGNEVFWKTRWESSIDGTSTPYRTLVSYKETAANAPIDPQDPPTWTGTWRDPRFSPPADGGRPENALTGTIFTANCCTDNAAITVSQQFASQPFWRNTRVATLPVGGSTTLAAGTLGYEWDENLNNGFRPAGLTPLSSTPLSVSMKLQDYGSTYAAGTATHALTLYQYAGALVFGAGTVQWSWGLDGNHDRNYSTPDLAMQQAMVNLLADMGSQPASLQPGLVPGTSDTTPPTVSMTAPVNGATVSGTTVALSATAADNVGVVGVQFKLDGANLGAEDTGTPYAATWNTTTTANGSHTLTAVARDAAGNTATSSGIAVVVSNAGDTTPPTVAMTAPATGATVLGTAVTVSATAVDNVGVAGVQFLLDGGATGAEVTTPPYAIVWNTTASANGTHTLSARARDGAGNATTAIAVSVTVSNAAPSCPCSIWSASAVPGPVAADGTAVELGLKFTSDTAGTVSAVRFYKYAQNIGTHTGSLWSASGTRLATVTFSGESASGWQQASFAPPLAISANTTYVVSYHTTAGYYAVTEPGLTAAIDNAPLHALANTTPGGNGVYLYSAAGGFPNQTWNASNYWVDVVFTPGAADTTAPTVALTAPAGGATVSGTAVTVSASAADNVGVAGVQFTLDGANLGAEDTASPFALTWNTTAVANGSHTLAAVARDAAGNKATATSVAVVVSNAASDTTPPTVSISAPASGATVSGTAVTVSATAADNVGVTGVQFKLDGANLGTLGTASPYAVVWNSTTASNGSHILTAVASDAAGNSTTAMNVTVTVSNAAGTCPCSLWNSSTVPAQMAADSSAVELGLKFTTDTAGFVSGVRFYKYAQNTGTHTGSLWSSSGTRLTTVTFSGESASGWQQATFATPIAVTANTTYVVSYHTNTGYYGVTQPGLTTEIDNSPVHAPSDSAAGGNGVYRYSASGAFPNQTYQASNYFVDVVFTH